MPDIKEKPKSAQIKSRDKKARSPREVSEGMKANAVRKLREKGREQLPDRQADVQDGVNHPNPGAHAAEQIEHGAYTGIRTTGDAAKAGLDRFRRKQAEKRKLHRAARQAEEQPAVHRPADERPRSTERTRDTGRTGEIAEPQRELWKEKAIEAKREKKRLEQELTASSSPASSSGAPLPVSEKSAAPEARGKAQAIKERRRDTSIKTRRTTGPAIKERGAAVSIKGQAAKPPVSKPASGIKSPRARTARTRLSSGAAKQARRHIEQQGRQFAAKKAAKATAQKTGQVSKKAGTAIVRAGKTAVASLAKGIGAVLAAGGGGILLVVLLFIGAIAAIASSPFGIFFAADRNGPDTVSVAEAIAQVNRDYNARLEGLQAGDYDSIVIEGTTPDWTEVLAVFACKTAGTDEGVDVATMDAERVELLKAVFWDMVSITTEVETIEHADSDPDDGTDDSSTETVLHITIAAKTAEEMRTVYTFTDYQNDALTELLADRASLSTLTGDLSITNVDAKALLDALPEDLSPERRAIIETACQLVGKVNYFWGGKSLVLGWDSRWGATMQVTADGSSTTGTYRPFGLDCSGYVDWVFYNASGGEYIIGHGGGAASQHNYCTAISWDDALPGDLVFYPEDSHVGIVGGRDENGNLIIIHCASGYNNVVITGLEGFTSIGRPVFYNE